MVTPAMKAFAAYIPSFTGTLSVLGSGSIVYSILSDRRKLREPQHRILLAMSVFDILYSLNKATIFLTYPANYGVPGALGNYTTCSMQGFFTEFGYAAGTYSAILSLYYYCTICLGMKADVFSKQIEPYMHTFMILTFVGFAITGVAIGLFNPVGAFCFIGPYPMGCRSNPDVPCERFGDTYAIYYEVFAQGWIQLSYVIVVVTNVAIWRKVYLQEKAIAKYTRNYTTPTTSGTKSTDKSRLDQMKYEFKHSKRVAMQSILYVGSFFLSWMFVTTYHLIGWIGGYQAFWPLPLINFFLPLQGFWNAFVYARPRYLSIRKKGRHLTFFQIVRLVFFPSTCDMSTMMTTNNPSRKIVMSSGLQHSTTAPNVECDASSTVVSNKISHASTAMKVTSTDFDSPAVNDSEATSIPSDESHTPDRMSDVPRMLPMENEDVSASSVDWGQLEKQGKLEPLPEKKRKKAETKRKKLQEEIKQIQKMLSDKLRLEAEIEASKRDSGK